MSFMDRLLGGQTTRREDSNEYVELDVEDFETDVERTGPQVHVARITGEGDLEAIKDAVYDGDIVVADITRHVARNGTMQRVSEELQRVAREAGGDIVQKDDDQLIITSRGVRISRQRLGQ